MLDQHRQRVRPVLSVRASRRSRPRAGSGAESLWSLEGHELFVRDAERELAGCAQRRRVADAQRARRARPRARSRSRGPGAPPPPSLRSGCVTGRRRPVSAISPNAHTGPSATPRAAETSASATARSAAGSSTLTPPATLTNTSCWPSPRPPWRASTASSSDRRLRSKPLASRRGIASSLGATSACTSIVSGRVPSIATNVQEPGRSRSARSCRRLASVTDTRPRSLISKSPISSVAPKRFFCARSTRSERSASPSNISTTSTRCSSTRGPGDGALLGHVPDQDDADAARLGQALQAGRGLAHLRHRSRRGRELLVPERLDGVDDADLGSGRLDRGADGLELGLGQHADARRRAQALGAQAHLLRRLLARHEQHRALSADRAQHGRRQARLADARLAAEQHERPGHEPAAEHAIELGDAGADARRGARLDGRERHHDAGLRALAARAAARVVGRGRLLDQRREGTAVGAAAEPAGLLAAALAADIGGAGAGHRISQASAAGGR